MISAYKYETHVHTYPASACGCTSPEEAARDIASRGYVGMFVTDHFFNGNSGIERSLPWEEKIRQMADCYCRAKAEGDKLGLDVFFGFEYASNGAEFLVYGLTDEFLYSHPDIMSLDICDALALMRESGAFITHAHPYRRAPHIAEPGRHFDGYIDAVEVYNACNGPDVNDPAMIYAEECGLLKFSGSDNHFRGNVLSAGVFLEKRIATPAEFIEEIRAGRYELAY